jgi:hypothetical protein
MVILHDRIDPPIDAEARSENAQTEPSALVPNTLPIRRVSSSSIQAS